MTETSEPGTVEAPDESVLAAFRGARHVQRRRPIRRVAVVAAMVFAGVSLVAIATNSDDVEAGDLDLVGGEITPADRPESAGGEGLGADGASSPPGGLPAGGDAGFDGAGPTGTDGAASPEAPPPPVGEPPPPAGDPHTPRSPAPEPPPDVAVVSPLLNVFAFGSRVGMPLLCSVATSALVGQVQDPTLAEVATTVVSSCIEFGTQGGEALMALNEQLAQLEAINPAAGPVIDALADVFNEAGSQRSVPFAEALFAMGEFVRFFSPN